MDLKVNSQLDMEFMNVQKDISHMPTPKKFNNIYDFAKRYINQLGLCARAIEKIYLLGYIEGKRDSKK